jgi:hypothetical protein
MMGTRARRIAHLLAAACFGALFACVVGQHPGAAQQEPPDLPPRGQLSDLPSKEEITKLGKVVEAQGFILRSRDGKLRGLLAADRRGEAGLELFDQQGRSRIRAGINNEGDPHLSIQSPDNKTWCTLRVSRNQSAELLFDTGGMRGHSLIVYVDRDDSKVAMYRGAKAVLDVTDLEGEPHIGLRDSKGESAMELIVDEDGRPRTLLSGKDQPALEKRRDVPR